MSAREEALEFLRRVADEHEQAGRIEKAKQLRDAINAIIQKGRKTK